MKSFYEMWRLLEGMDYDAWLTSGYDDGEDSFSFSRILGEDKGSPFNLEVEIDNGGWRNTGGIWVLGYVPNGSENPASKPVFHKAGMNGYDADGTEFNNPGEGLELLPASIRDEAIKWVQREVDHAISGRRPGRREDDPRGYDDREPYNPDPHGHGWEDHYWKHGPGRDPL